MKIIWRIFDKVIEINIINPKFVKVSFILDYNNVCTYIYKLHWSSSVYTAKLFSEIYDNIYGRYQGLFKHKLSTFYSYSTVPLWFS